MSGVFGIVDSQRRLEVGSLANKMAASMSHRDWLVAEQWVNSTRQVALGRLGIGLFNQTRQPVWNTAETIALVMAGEFYNREALIRPDETDYSDEQVALTLYEEYGDKFAGRLDGIFIIAIWDKTRQRLVITNDRFGLYPLYYAHHTGRLLFAPEMKGILGDASFSKKLDLTALAEYVRFQHLLGDKTFFEDLKLLPNASFLNYDLQTDCLTIKPYWDLSQIPQLPATLTFDEAAEEAGRRLKAAITRLTTGSYRLGVYLSAGVDSRVILGFIGRDLFPVTTVTFGQRGCRDVAYAERIAAKVGTDHHYFEFVDGQWVEDFAAFHLELTEGFHSWIHAHGISILDQVRPLLEVNLTGFGGGQSAIDWEQPLLFQAEDDTSFSIRLFQLLSQQTTWPSIDEVEEKFLFSPRLASELRDLAFTSFCSELSKYENLPYYQRAAYFALCNPDRRLFQYYIVFHRSYFEQRFPFYDYPYVEFVYALPPEMLFKRRLRRAIILKMMPELATVPYDKDNLPITAGAGSKLAAILLQKGKSVVNRLAPVFPQYTTLYADYEHWLRYELRTWGEGILLGEQTLQRDLFNPEFLRSIWRRHQAGLEPNIIGKLAPIMSYELMLRRFYD